VNAPADKFCGGCAKSLRTPAKPRSTPPPVVPKAVTHTIPIAIFDDAILSAIDQR